MNAELVYQGEVPNETGLPGRSSERSLELGDPRKKCVAAQTTAQKLTIKATTCNVCDGMR
jgi:hypothetical protein